MGTPGAMGTPGEPAPGSRRVLRPSAADEVAFQALLDGALTTAQKMAGAWRTGMAGLVTLITTGVVVSGRTTASSLTTPWRAVVTLAVGGGLALAVLGLWHALAAEVGVAARPRSLDEILREQASVEAYTVRQAWRAGERLATARRCVAIALALLLTGVLLTWWAPEAPSDPPALVTVTGPDGAVCGTLLSADGGAVRVRVSGRHDPAVIPLDRLRNMAVTATCR